VHSAFARQAAQGVVSTIVPIRRSSPHWRTDVKPVPQDPDRSDVYEPAQEPLRDDYGSWRSSSFAPRRPRWPGVLAALVIGGVVVGLAVSSYYEQATLGERIDHTLEKAGQTVQQNVQAVREGASVQTDKLANAVGDASITAGVKAALAADPALSALKIDVTTQDGVVSLEGPAPDEKARERAAALAAAPDGVVRVENRLVVQAVAASQGPQPAR
jgi:hyperosmotically inducible protein